MSNQKGWCISKIGWCVGSNPPFVVCGIRLIGLPAPPVEGHQRLFALSTCRTAVSPLPPELVGTMRASFFGVWGTCRFCSVAKALALHPERVLQFYAWAEFPQTLKFRVRKPHTNSPAQKEMRVRRQ
jgi:hypothetical protein